MQNNCFRYLIFISCVQIMNEQLVTYFLLFLKAQMIVGYTSLAIVTVIFTKEILREIRKKLPSEPAAQESDTSKA